MSSPVRVVPWPAEQSIMDQVERIDAAAFPPGTRSSPREELERPFTRGWIATLGESAVVAGYLLTWHVADELHILNIATDRPFRRRGVARALLQQALAYARDNGIRLLLLEVRRSNRAALALYRSLGFHVTSVRERYYSDNQEDALELMLYLDPATGRVLDPPDHEHG